MPTARRAAEPASYEDALAELERLVQPMEAGQLPLDRLLDSYRRGAELLELLPRAPGAVEEQVKVLEDGQLKPWTRRMKRGRLRRLGARASSTPSRRRSTRWVPADAPAGLGEAMRYGVLDGGKRLRPLLVLAACEAVARPARGGAARRRARSN